MWLAREGAGGGLRGRAGEAATAALREVESAIRKIKKFTPERIVCKTMWDSDETTMVWAAEGHAFALEDIPGLSFDDAGRASRLGHPLRPRGTADRNTMEVSAWPDGQFTQERDDILLQEQARIAGRSTAGVPPRLEIRASFDGFDDGTGGRGFVVAMVFGQICRRLEMVVGASAGAGGAGSSSETSMPETETPSSEEPSWRGADADGTFFKLHVGFERIRASFGDPLVSAEEAPGASAPRQNRVKACAEAAALTVWREAAAGPHTTTLFGLNVSTSCGMSHE